MNVITKSFDLGDGRTVTIETGKLAKQADGSAVIKVGDTAILATIVSDKDAGEDVDFLPLTVEYKEKFASAGKIPGGFIKRETRPSEHEILIARLIDRALRPLFPKDYHANTVVTVHLISSGQVENPDSYACLAASAALAASDIPFDGPVSEARVARVDNNFIINPSIEQAKNADIDMIIAATADSVVMVEGEMDEASEDEMTEAIKFAHDAIKTQCATLKEIQSEVGKGIREYEHEAPFDEETFNKMKEFSYQRCYDIANQGINDKHKRSELFKAVKTEFLETLDSDMVAENGFVLSQYYNKIQKEAVRNVVLDTKKRLDGRNLDEIRGIWSEVDSFKGPHGCAIFTRGETQSLTTVTLGNSMDVQNIDGAVHEGSMDFILHYNFPPFSTGEARPPRSTSRREIGHGNLAYRALKGMIPSEGNPYTIRVVSDILESNGSSSMATVCAGSLALMDAGVNLRKPVSGIAMGLISNETGNFAVLSDILGDEDHLGDMDFKVAGTVDGITAVQMDIKVKGLSYEVLGQALTQAKAGRLHILSEMSKTLDTPREDYKPHVPRIESIMIEKEFIGAIIGPGGKNIQELQKATNTVITITEQDEKGEVQIASNSKDDMQAAIDRVKAMTTVPIVGETYEAVVKGIKEYGAFVEFLPGKQGLLHISEISWTRLESLDGVLAEGDNLKVKLLDIDKRSGKFKLSRKVLIPKPETTE